MRMLNPIALGVLLGAIVAGAMTPDATAAVEADTQVVLGNPCDNSEPDCIYLPPCTANRCCISKSGLCFAAQPQDPGNPNGDECGCAT